MYGLVLTVHTVWEILFWAPKHKQIVFDSKGGEMSTDIHWYWVQKLLTSVVGHSFSQIIVLYVKWFKNEILFVRFDCISIIQSVFDKWFNRYSIKSKRTFQFIRFINLIDPAPKLSSNVHFKNQSEGSAFYVLCAAEEGSLPLFFEWTKNGQNIKSIPNVNHKIEYLDMSSTLTIKKITRSDSGNYTCSVKNTIGSDIQSVLLTVKGINIYYLISCLISFLSYGSFKRIWYFSSIALHRIMAFLTVCYDFYVSAKSETNVIRIKRWRNVSQ